MEWFRAYHGISSDSKWPVIARKSGQTVGVVVSVWMALLDHASQDENRGSIDGFDCEEIDALYGYDDGTVASVLAAMESKGMIVDGCIKAWEKRQPGREDVGSETAMSAKERQQLCRANKKILELEQKIAREKQHTESPEKSQLVTEHIEKECNVTPCHEVSRDVTPCHEVSRQEQNREDKNILNTPPIPPQGGTLADIPADDPSTLPEICDADGYAEPAGYDGTSPSIEFQEIREAYNASGRIEPPMAGHKEYAALRKTMRWPGMSAIFTAIDRFSADDCQWKEGKIPGLGRFLAEEWWRMPPRAAPAVRDEPRATTVRQKQERDFGKLVTWALGEEQKNARLQKNGAAIDAVGKQLPEARVIS